MSTIADRLSSASALVEDPTPRKTIIQYRVYANSDDKCPGGVKVSAPRLKITKRVLRSRRYVDRKIAGDLEAYQIKDVRVDVYEHEIVFSSESDNSIIDLTESLAIKQPAFFQRTQ